MLKYLTYDLPAGPFGMYLGKVPDGETAATWDGSGSHWFKIWELGPDIEPGSFTFDTTMTQWTTAIPKTIQSGDYLLRMEHIGLHSAQQVGGAQFYIGCAQVKIEGKGTYEPASKVALPGAYKATDPGIKIDIWYPVPTSYTDPGPKPMTCSS